jgi:hypothetical protein
VNVDVGRFTQATERSRLRSPTYPRDLSLLGQIALCFVAIGIGALVGLLPDAMTILVGFGVGILLTLLVLTRLRKKVSFALNSLTWTQRALLLACFLLACDITALTSQAIPYALVSIVCMAAIIDARGPASTTLMSRDYLLVALVGWGVVAAATGRIFDGQQFNGLAFFAPLVIGVLPVLAPRAFLTTESNAKVLTLSLAVIGLSYSAISFAIWVVQLDVLPPNDFKHSRVFLTCFAVVGLALSGQKLLSVLVVAMGIGTFLAYPALTVALAAVVGVTLLVCVRYRWAPLLLLPILILFVAYAVSNLASARVEYFSYVGKTDNTPARQALLETGLVRFYESPVVGDGFTKNLSVESSLTGPYTQVPVHNDYLELAMSGGLIGAGLFCTWAALTLFSAYRCAVHAARLELKRIHALAVTVLVGVATLLLSALVNPVLNDTSNSFVLAVLSVVLSAIERTLPIRHLDVGGKLSAGGKLAPSQ